MHVVVCPRCHTEMGFEKLPIYVDCKTCTHRFLSGETAQPQAQAAIPTQQREPKSYARQQLSLLRTFSVLMLSFMLGLPAIVYDATGSSVPSFFGITAMVGGLLFIFALLAYVGALIDIK